MCLMLSECFSCLSTRLLRSRLCLTYSRVKTEAMMELEEALEALETLESQLEALDSLQSKLEPADRSYFSK